MSDQQSSSQIPQRCPSPLPPRPPTPYPADFPVPFSGQYHAPLRGPTPVRAPTPIPPLDPTAIPPRAPTPVAMRSNSPLPPIAPSPSPLHPGTPSTSYSEIGDESAHDVPSQHLRPPRSLVDTPPPKSENVEETDKDNVYNDPTADVILNSGDEKVFRVHSYMLKANSDVFRDMLVADHIGTPGQAIELDTPSGLLRRFLDVMHDTPWRPTGSYEECKELLEVLAKYGASRLADRILSRIAECDDADAWDMFALASHYDHVGLAKLAIQLMGKNDYLTYSRAEEIDTRAAEKVRAPYLVALFKTLARVTSSSSSRGGSSTPSWYEISAKFTLDDPETRRYMRACSHYPRPVMC